MQSNLVHFPLDFLIHFHYLGQALRKMDYFTVLTQIKEFSKKSLGSHMYLCHMYLCHTFYGLAISQDYAMMTKSWSLKN